MSSRAKKIWDSLVFEMAPSGVLRKVDALGLAHLCEDQAELEELRHGVQLMAKQITETAKTDGKKLPGNAMVALSRTNEGRRTFSIIRELSGQIIVQRREFGLTPASNSRVSAAFGGAGSSMDPLEAALCG